MTNRPDVIDMTCEIVLTKVIDRLEDYKMSKADWDDDKTIDDCIKIVAEMRDKFIKVKL